MGVLVAASIVASVPSSIPAAFRAESTSHTAIRPVESPAANHLPHEEYACGAPVKQFVSSVAPHSNEEVGVRGCARARMCAGV